MSRPLTARTRAALYADPQSDPRISHAENLYMVPERIAIKNWLASESSEITKRFLIRNPTKSKQKILVALPCTSLFTLSCNSEHSNRVKQVIFSYSITRSGLLGLSGLYIYICGFIYVYANPNNPENPHVIHRVMCVKSKLKTRFHSQ